MFDFAVDRSADLFSPMTWRIPQDSLRGFYCEFEAEAPGRL